MMLFSPEFQDGEWNVAHLGGKQSWPAAVAAAAAFLSAIMANGIENGCDLQFDQLAQAVAGHLMD